MSWCVWLRHEESAGCAVETIVCFYVSMCTVLNAVKRNFFEVMLLPTQFIDVIVRVGVYDSHVHAGI